MQKTSAMPAAPEERSEIRVDLKLVETVRERQPAKKEPERKDLSLIHI